MKMFKKTLLLTTTLALSFTLAGCKKASGVNSNWLDKVKKWDTIEKFTDLEESGSVVVKSYNRINNRILWYVTTDDKYVIYDLFEDSIILETVDKITNVSQTYNDQNAFITVTYTDSDSNVTQQVLGINGEVILKKDRYVNLSRELVHSVYNNKVDNYEDAYFRFTYRVFGEEDLKVEFYKLSYKGVKNSKKVIIKDLSQSGVTYAKASQADCLTYKQGDKVISDGKSYAATTASGQVSIVNSITQETIYNFNVTYSNYKVLFFNDKALVQFVSSVSGSQTNNVIEVGSDKYVIETYKVDLKTKKCELVTDFDYYIVQSTGNTGDNCLALRNVGVITNGKVLQYTTLLLGDNFKVECDSNKYYYTSSFYDLGNGKLIAYDYASNLAYLTDKNGKIIKVFEGKIDVYKDSKVIMINNNNILRFIDFNGEYVNDESYETYGPVVIKDGVLWYSEQLTNQRILLKFNDKGITKEVVDYRVSTDYTPINASNLNMSEEDYEYVYYGRAYYTLTLNNTDSDPDIENFDVHFYDIDGNAIDGTITGVGNLYLVDATSLTEGTRYVNIFTSTYYDTTYTLKFYKLS